MAASYRKAVEWIALNDDINDIEADPENPPPVTACLVADLFGKDDAKVVRDVLKAAKRSRDYDQRTLV